MPDKYTATWVSHTSLCDFLHCQRAYYLKNVYRNPDTGHKIQLMSPPLALGSAVHEVIESLSILPTDRRFSEPLLEKFERSWKKVSGKMGGFSDEEHEQRYKARGEAMLKRVITNPGPLKNLAVKIKEDLPHYWLSEDDEIILCGKIDWLEYLPNVDAVHIIDFKTSKKEEDGNSLQLPIYHLLVHNCQHRTVKKASYWYLEFSDDLTEKELPDLEEAREQIMDPARKMKLARKLELFKCLHGGCSACESLERVIRGEGELVGTNSYNQDVYILNTDTTEESVIL